jgi:hypothetical protein
LKNIKFKKIWYCKLWKSSKWYNGFLSKEKALQRLKSENINPKMLVNKKWIKVEYSEITLDYFLETWYRKLFLTREKNLTSFQKIRLSQIFRDLDLNLLILRKF